MLNRISNFFYNKTKILFIIIPLILILSMFIIMPAFEKALGMDENLVSLDSSNIYSPETIHTILSEWGYEGRLQQIWFHFTWDLIFPLLYFFYIGFLLSWLAKRGFKKNSKMQKTNLLAAIAVADILENISLLFLILAYPKDAIILGYIKTALTMIKYFLFGPLILITLIVLLIFAIKNKFRIQE